MRQVKRLLPYVRRYVQMAVYDVLDAEGAEYRKEESGAVVGGGIPERGKRRGGRPAFGLRERQHLQPFDRDTGCGDRTDGFHA